MIRKHVSISFESCSRRAALVAVVLCVQVLSACAKVPSLSVASDSATFSLVVAHLKTDSFTFHPLMVEPRPLRSNLSPPSSSDSAVTAQAKDSFVVARKSILRRLSVDETNDASSRNCPGAIGETLRRELIKNGASFAGCPEEKRMVAAIGLPTRGGASVFFAGPDAPDLRDVWTVHVTTMHFNGGAAWSTHWVYLVRFEQDRWVYVDRRAVSTSE